MRGYANAVALAAAVYAGASHALDLGLALPSVFRVAIGADDDGGSDYSVDLDLGLTSGQRLTFAHSRSRSTEDGVSLEPHLLRIGVGSDPLDRINVAMSLEQWGQDDAVVTRSLRGRAELRNGDLRLYAAPQMRAIEIFLATSLARFGDSVQINSQGLELGVGASLGERLNVRGYYFSNDYSRDPAVLQSADVRLISDVTFNLAAGLEEDGGGVSLTLATAWGSAGADWSQSQSAVDGVVSTTVALALDVDLGSGSTLQLSGGQQSASDGTSQNFAGLGLACSWE